MMMKRHWHCLWSLALMSSLGCVPEENRAPTVVKSAGEIEITAGEVKEIVEEPAESAAPSTSATTATESTAAASPVATAAGGDTTPAAAPAEKSAVAKVEMKPTNDPPANVAAGNGSTTFAGRVIVKGTAPDLPAKLKQGQPTKDAICAENEIPDESVVVSESGGLAYAFVYMKKAPKSGVPAPTGDAPVIDQKGCVFLPHAVVCQIGQPLHLKNSDPVAHNVRINGFSTAFNQTIPANDTSGLDFEFPTAERLPAEVRCDFHAWMGGWVLPLDHPWGTVTDSEGNFAIENLPDGKWEFVVWHEKVGYVDRGFSVSIAQGQVVNHTFEVDASKLAQ